MVVCSSVATQLHLETALESPVMCEPLTEEACVLREMPSGVYSVAFGSTEALYRRRAILIKHSAHAHAFALALQLEAGLACLIRVKHNGIDHSQDFTSSVTLGLCNASSRWLRFDQL